MNKKSYKITPEQQEKKDARRQDAKKSVEDAAQTLFDEMQQGKSEHYQEWLKFAAQFHNYSFLNTLLLKGQAKKRGFRISHVASFKHWTDLGYQVRKGESALYVWAPRPFKTTVENKQTHEEEEREYTGFVLVPVFDASQIMQGEGFKSLESFFPVHPSNETARALFSASLSVAQSEGYDCKEESLSHGHQGYNQGKKIVVKTELDDVSKLSTFIHEWTHATLDHTSKSNHDSYNEGECEAESVAFIVCQHFGIDTQIAPDYLKMYHVDVKMLNAHLERIRKTAHDMIVKIEKALSAEQEEAAA